MSVIQGSVMKGMEALRRRFVMLAAAFVMVGCSSSDVKVEPAPLPVLDQPIKLQLAWKKDLGKGVGDKYLMLKPAFSEGTVYMIDFRGLLIAVDPETGKKRWKRKLNEHVSSGLTVAGERIWYGAPNGDLVCLSAEDGKELWRKPLSSELLAPVLIDGSMLVAQTSDGRVYALSDSDGHQKWVYETAVPILSLRGTARPQAAAGAIVAAFANGKLVVLNRETGLPIWDKQVAVPKGRSELEKMVDIDGAFVIDDDTIYIASFQGRIAAMALYTGRVIWQSEMSSYVDIGVGGRALYVSDSQGVVWALDRATGNVLWKQEGLLARTLSGPQRYQDYVVVGDFEGYLHWLSAKEGAFVGRVRIDRKGIRSQPFKQSGALFVSGVGGQLARVELNIK